MNYRKYPRKEIEKGIVYFGEIENDKFHGKGELTTKNSTYKGYFDKGLKEGWGIEEFLNGDTYKGNYHLGMFHGQGSYH